MKPSEIFADLHSNLEGDFDREDAFFCMVISKKGQSFMRVSAAGNDLDGFIETAQEQIDELRVKSTAKDALVMFSNKLFNPLSPDQRRALLNISPEVYKTFKTILDGTNASELEGLEALKNDDDVPDFSDAKAIEEWYKRQFKGGDQN